MSGQQEVRADTTGLPVDVPDSLPLPVADNHAHLDITREGHAPVDVADVLRQAAQVGVTKVVQVGCDVDGIEYTMRAVQEHANVVGAIALHPNEVPKLAAAGRLADAYALLESCAVHERIRAIGETGLDHYWTEPPQRAVQEEGFRRHIDLAKRLGKAMQVHDRDAHADILRVVDSEGAPERTVMHCFSGDMAFARECVDRGFYLSFSGTVTFKNARGLRDALSVVPEDRLLVETDAPYLTPHPFRGRTNASWLVPVTVRAMAAARNTDVPSLCRALMANTERVYGTW